MAEGLADAVALAGPSLPTLTSSSASAAMFWAAVQRETLYGGREEGYTDHPTLTARSTAPRSDAAGALGAARRAGAVVGRRLHQAASGSPRLSFSSR